MRFIFTKIKIMKRIPSWLKNKYVLSIIVFFVWMLFFDRNDFISQFSYRKDLRKLETDKEYYQKEIEQNKKDTKELMSDPKHLEKFARERYLMKKDNEDIFLIVYDQPKKEEQKFKEWKLFGIVC